ncbi:hypothetical protein [Pantoea sp. SO10]|uniref:hypothetical protein n=1 Tax=Pantoea sp. SO10 TaxID=2575375 RepID=UPI0010C9433E|nr:hypothetical protein [Pantoea sp. SO10]QCP58810.1 hypothetical protein FCN45_05210 [Pantoea sp. SO10]
MTWNIPLPHPIRSPSPPRWSLWWRVLVLCCIVTAVSGTVLWFWLQDSRTVLWTLGIIALITVIFTLIAGWMLFRSGVDEEHAQGLMAYNRLQEFEWQRWAQQAVHVSGWHAVFAPQARLSMQPGEPVTNDIPLLLPSFPGYRWLSEEVIMSLLTALQAVTSRWPIEVSLPDDADHNEWRQFADCWQQAGLPMNRLAGQTASVSSYDSAISSWLDAPLTYRARLVIVKYWTGSGEHTEGVIACLLTPRDHAADIPVRCSLHRTMNVSPGDEAASFSQFLHYQPLTSAMAGLWTDRNSQPQAAQLVMVHSQRLKSDEISAAETETGIPAVVISPAAPEQHWLPHWLGQTGPCADWFALTLMMSMAEHNGGVQCGLLSGASPSSQTWILSSVSAGAFSDD